MINPMDRQLHVNVLRLHIACLRFATILEHSSGKPSIKQLMYNLKCVRGIELHD